MKKTMKNYAMALMLGMGFAGVNTAAHAADDVSVYADIGGFSQYIWRAAAQGDGRASLQGDVGVEHASGVSANIWFATGVGTDETEYDITLDYSGEAGDIGYSVGFIAFKFVKDSGLDANEFYVGASFDIASLTAYIGDGYNYIEAGVGATVADMFDASAAVGINSPDTGTSTTHITLGASKDFDMGSYTLSPSLTIGSVTDLDTEVALGVNASF
ncbi:MAG TPA: hypothetical protein EYP39_00590 [Ghiorsea sp.]|nr:hypothetical protein [Ghiorsea sp.]HIP06538.1 hypothetical protein [Mariprofundaceae bacterium]